MTNAAMNTNAARDAAEEAAMAREITSIRDFPFTARELGPDHGYALSCNHRDLLGLDGHPLSVRYSDGSQAIVCSEYCAHEAARKAVIPRHH